MKIGEFFLPSFAKATDGTATKARRTRRIVSREGNEGCEGVISGLPDFLLKMLNFVFPMVVVSLRYF
jgi:hypothetical protein